MYFWRCDGEEGFFFLAGIPAGLKGSDLLLLPITGQSPALSTCKMTLAMPVLMLFYTLRLCVSEMRPLGAAAVGARPLLSTHQPAERVGVSSRVRERLKASEDSLLEVFFFCFYYLLPLNGLTVPKSAAA